MSKNHQQTTRVTKIAKKPVIIKAQTLHGNVMCPECELPMVENPATLCCPHPWCDGFNVQYKFPTVEIERA